MKRLRYITCFAHEDDPVGHGYYRVPGKAGRTLCGKTVRGSHWVDEGEVENGDDFSCKVCQKVWVKMPYNFH